MWCTSAARGNHMELWVAFRSQEWPPGWLIAKKWGSQSYNPNELNFTKKPGRAKKQIILQSLQTELSLGNPSDTLNLLMLWAQKPAALCLDLWPTKLRA